jgi:hypothetical protein
MQKPLLENTAMRFRYSDNLARGFGISRNADEAPRMTDGAADLTFVLSLAPVVFIGIPVTPTAKALKLGRALALNTMFARAGRLLSSLPRLGASCRLG